MDFGDFKEMLRQQAPDNRMQSIKIDLSDLEILRDLLHIYRRLYQHELTPEPLKDYIYTEVRRTPRKDLDICGFLEGQVKIF